MTKYMYMLHTLDVCTCLHVSAPSICPFKVIKQNYYNMWQWMHFCTRKYYV